ncbi:hypothetical protein SIN8267_02508 [Sinobacterium norvegicum]|uniref:Uncharacterized protein n=1 Tax=Sinobacterium norvegicum TaxID=1641715 RepID=A0ABM9AGQ0_9GAMM|nr:hypothetical protein [Sinobacterium norvegicum]CAH0992389.1 hypothetical protein SIN8267_02508 [Sinobacterium norvegicum]
MDDFELDQIDNSMPHFEGEHDGDGFYLEECLEDQLDTMQGFNSRHQRLDEIDAELQKELDTQYSETKLSH